MITVNLECLYCGNKWKEAFMNMTAIEYAYCPICKDSSLKVSPETHKSDIFGYGSQEAKEDAYIKKS